MPAFTYTARALNGDLRTATIEAPNRDEVVAQLRRDGQNGLERGEIARQTPTPRRRKRGARSRCATS